MLYSFKKFQNVNMSHKILKSFNVYEHRLAAKQRVASRQLPLN